MKIIHVQLKSSEQDSETLRYFLDQPSNYGERSLPLKEIEDLIQIAERDYYIPLPEDFVKTGQRLYNWLDGSDRWLAKTIKPYRGEVVVLAITTSSKLAHLPWELLHDGTSFLVARRNPFVVPVRWLPEGEPALEEPKNRALQVLFMATSPLGVQPVLNFEAEEGEILKATEKQPLSLIVEESGWLEQLRNLVASRERGDFDVLHLTGHATKIETGARFLTETETGECYYASAQDIAEVLHFRLPQLIFLSGCHTGEAGRAGAVRSMAEELLNEGAGAVLGWGRSVLDSDATDAAAALYGALSSGYKLAEAVAFAYQALIKKEARDWHLLRLYVQGEKTAGVPGALVTPLNTSGRRKVPSRSAAEQFPESFVGRRRQLQSCLRSLSQSQNQVGVLIYGLGGVGKSSLAKRLCDRLPEFERIGWKGRVDEGNLVRGLAEKLPKELRQVIQSPDELKFRLRDVFERLEKEEGAVPQFLLVLDDFKENLEPRNGGYVLQPEAVMVLEALVWAIRETKAHHRLILASRCDFDSPQLQYFHKQPLDALQGADLQKK